MKTMLAAQGEVGAGRCLGTEVVAMKTMLAVAGKPVAFPLNARLAQNDVCVLLAVAGKPAVFPLKARLAQDDVCVLLAVAGKPAAFPLNARLAQDDVWVLRLSR